MLDARGLKQFKVESEKCKTTTQSAKLCGGRAIDFCFFGQPQVRLIFPIFNRPRPVFVNLNLHLFFVPCPTSPKSKTVLSKEIRGNWFSAAKANHCMLIDNERKRGVKTNSIKSLFRYISHFTSSYSYNSSVLYYSGQQGLFSQFFCPYFSKPQSSQRTQRKKRDKLKGS